MLILMLYLMKLLINKYKGTISPYIYFLLIFKYLRKECFLMGLIFDEESMINGNVFKFEQRLNSHVNKYMDNGMILTTYFSQNENATTVDRGLRDIDQLFGDRSPIRMNKIKNFPLCGFGPTNPENSDEQQIEDFNVEGDCTVIPSTIVPKQYDCFIVDHLKMKAVFLVTSVNYDSMKPEGFYKIHYRLHSTSEETLLNLNKQTVATYRVELNALGSDLNPVIREDRYIERQVVKKVEEELIDNYISLFYNSRHNCFLYYHKQTGIRYFDMCGNEFMAKHNLMNYEGSSRSIILHNKLNDSQLPLYYSYSIYRWIERDAKSELVQRFYYELTDGLSYPYSSFYRWSEDDIQVIYPLAVHQTGMYNQSYTYFDNKQLESFLDPNTEPSSIVDKIIWKYINHFDKMTLGDIPSSISDMMFVSYIDSFFYVPILIFIIRKLLSLN